MRKGPPQGLEIELRRGMEHSWEDDTLVMANYGYFQLKTNPGLLTVGLKAGISPLCWGGRGSVCDVRGILPHIDHLDGFW